MNRLRVLVRLLQSRFDNRAGCSTNTPQSKPSFELSRPPSREATAAAESPNRRPPRGFGGRRPPLKDDAGGPLARRAGRFDPGQDFRPKALAGRAAAERAKDRGESSSTARPPWAPPPATAT